ncbi:MAG TPA: hypothetical protein VFF36_09330, partial [Planctomycetota bacterium]|nr:hypothetical protein [Planctomycetota bacterium]
AGAVWAVVALAEHRAATGAFDAAKHLLYELADVGESEKLIELGLDVAARAAAHDGSRELAAEIYEMLRERDPANRRVWEPLVDLYRTLGDADRLQATIANTLPNLVDRSERNTLRMQHVAYLIEVARRSDSAAEVLRDVLLDDPDHLEAAGRLEEVLRGSGDRDGLADFLWQRFEEARGRGNPDTIVDVACRLGGLLDEMQSPEAATVFRTALESAPHSRELLRAVLAHMDPEMTEPRERAGLMERLLEVDDPERVPALAGELASLYESLGDDLGVRRALVVGFRRCPGDAEIHARLEQHYRDRGLWQPLAQMMLDDAEHLAEHAPMRAIARLVEAAGIHRDMLGDPRAAAAVLARARTMAPNDDQLVGAEVASLVAAGEPGKAIEAISDSLAGEMADGARVNLLLTRADLH